MLTLLICTLPGCGKNEQSSDGTTEASGSRSIDEPEYESETETEKETKKSEKKTEKEKTTKSKDKKSKKDKTIEAQTEKKNEAPEKIIPEKSPDSAADFFDDAVFVGDSVSLGLRNYVSSRRNSGKDCLGSAQFLVAGSMGYCNSRGKIGSKDAVHPKYKGKEVTIEEGVALTGAKKVFIMLGLNDFCIYPLDESMKNVKKTVDAIKEKNPGAKIYIQSVTPVISAKERGKFNNDTIDAFNSALRMTADECGCEFVDIAPLMKDSGGCFRDDYCSDPEDQGVHMNSTGSQAWIEYLTQKYC